VQREGRQGVAEGERKVGGQGAVKGEQIEGGQGGAEGEQREGEQGGSRGTEDEASLSRSSQEAEAEGRGASGVPGWHNAMSGACRRERTRGACGDKDVVVRAQGDLSARLAALCGAEAVAALTPLTARVFWHTDPTDSLENPPPEVVHLGGMRGGKPAEGTG